MHLAHPAHAFGPQAQVLVADPDASCACDPLELVRGFSTKPGLGPTTPGLRAVSLTFLDDFRDFLIEFERIWGNRGRAGRFAV